MAEDAFRDAAWAMGQGRPAEPPPQGGLSSLAIRVLLGQFKM
jgi:hypothetical protein